MSTEPREVTQLLAKLSAGESEASSRLIQLVYGELRAMAHGCMRRERPGHTLQATGLVHEAYLRLAGQDIQWQNRAHFFGIAARVMRRVLLDYAREHRAKKRSGGKQVTLEDRLIVSQERLEDILILDECIEKLAAIDPQQSRLIEFRFYAGMSVEETSEVMGISTATVKREWSYAKAWLAREMNERPSRAA